jgi:hypothetical protein
MSPTSDAGGYVQTFPAVLREMMYEVVAGDATAGPYSIRVDRPPTVAEIAAPISTTQPGPDAQYHDALQAYFQALGEVRK